MNAKKFLIALLITIILVGGTGLTYKPAQAAACTRIHIVRPGQSLSWIGRYYGVSWTYLAQINNIKKPGLIYSGQKICISVSGSVPAASSGWSFEVINKVKDTSVTLRTHNIPSNVLFDVKIGRKVGGSMDWQDVGPLDSDRGGSIKATFSIPGAYAGESRLAIRLIQDKKGTTVTRWFTNAGGGTGGGGVPWYYGGIPTFSIVGVVRNSTVTIRTYNFPAGLNFDVYMGPMGTRGIGGYYIGTFNSGAGGTFVKTFNTPSQLYNHNQISIRSQNTGTGYYSYNWFYNNTTP